MTENEFIQARNEIFLASQELTWDEAAQRLSRLRDEALLVCKDPVVAREIRRRIAEHLFLFATRSSLNLAQEHFTRLSDLGFSDEDSRFNFTVILARAYAETGRSEDAVAVLQPLSERLAALGLSNKSRWMQTLNRLMRAYRHGNPRE